MAPDFTLDQKTVEPYLRRFLLLATRTTCFELLATHFNLKLAHHVSQDVNEDTPIIEICTRELIVAYTDEVLSQATNKMLKHGVGRLPVVVRDDPEKLVGYLGRAQIVEARQQVLNEEHVRERGWLLSR